MSRGRGPWVVVACALSSSGCLTRVHTRVDVVDHRVRLGAPDSTRDLSVKVLPSAAGTTRLGVSSVGRCAELDQTTRVDVVRSTGYVHPVWAALGAGYGAIIVANAVGGSDKVKVPIGLAAGAGLFALGFSVGVSDESRGEPRVDDVVVGWKRCDVQPAPGVRVTIWANETEWAAQAGDDGVVSFGVGVEHVREVVVLGLRVRLR